MNYTKYTYSTAIMSTAMWITPTPYTG